MDYGKLETIGNQAAAENLVQSGPGDGGWVNENRSLRPVPTSGKD